MAKSPVPKKAPPKKAAPKAEPPKKPKPKARETSSKASVAPTPVKEDRKWQIESDMRTLMQAEEVKNDPKRLAEAQKMAKEHANKMAKIAGK